MANFDQNGHETPDFTSKMTKMTLKWVIIV